MYTYVQDYVQVCIFAHIPAANLSRVHIMLVNMKCSLKNISIINCSGRSEDGDGSNVSCWTDASRRHGGRALYWYRRFFHICTYIVLQGDPVPTVCVHIYISRYM